jgi:signal-transduction protein with cAMP-binding, CBS, and nucleotidyltransferase domain
MQLKVQGIENDPVKKIGIVTLIDILDDFPQVSASVKLVTIGSQTQAEILANLKNEIKVLLEEAIKGLDRFTNP